MSKLDDSFSSIARSRREQLRLADQLEDECNKLGDLLERGKLDEVGTRLERLRSLRKQAVEIPYAGDLGVRALMVEGGLLQDTGRFAPARKCYSLALEVTQQIGSSKDLKAQLGLLVGTTLEMEGDHASAKAQYERVILEDAHSLSAARANVRIGSILQKERVAGASDFVLRGMRNMWSSTRNLSLAYQKLCLCEVGRDWDIAERHLIESRRLIAPDDLLRNVQWLLVQADLDIARGQLEEAGASLRLARLLADQGRLSHQLEKVSLRLQKVLALRISGR